MPLIPRIVQNVVSYDTSVVPNYLQKGKKDSSVISTFANGFPFANVDYYIEPATTSYIKIEGNQIVWVGDGSNVPELLTTYIDVYLKGTYGTDHEIYLGRAYFTLLPPATA
jgi:hypothetical protein